MKVTACMLIIGDEILSGRTQDKNLQVLAKRLNEKGVQLSHVRVIPDDEEIIISTLNDVRKAYDYVFTTGGIGPTHDDITSETVAKALGLEWGIHQEAFDLLQAYYAKTDLPFNESCQKMAKTPKGAKLLDNPVSVAPGFVVENIFVMAGVPSIMEVMLDFALPLLKGGAVVFSKSMSCNLGEGTVAETLSAFQTEYKDVSIGSYPIFQVNNMGLHLVLRSSDESKLQELYDKLFVKLTEMGGKPEEVAL